MSALDTVFPKEDRPSQGNRGLGVVLLGDFETGKTFFIGTCPETVILLDLDDGTEAMWEQYDFVSDETYEGNFAGKDIRVIEIPISSSLEESGLDDVDDIEDIEFETNLVNAIENYEKEFAKVEALARGGHLKGCTVALDTATWLWLGCMDYMKYKVLKLDTTAKNYVNQQWDWDIANKKYINLYKRLMALRKYGVNVVITVHVKEAYEATSSNGRTSVSKTDNLVPHWMKKSPQMSPLILQIDKKVVVEDGKAVEKRMTRCVRMRGVPNAKKLFKPIEDITYQKLLEELHNVRLRSEGKLVEGDEQEATSTTKATPTVRRRTRRVV